MVLVKLKAKSGSMPLEQPAIMLRVPVGAMVVRVALRTCGPLGYIINAALESRENAAFGSQLCGGLKGLLADKCIMISATVSALPRIVSDAQHDEHIREAHDAQADLSGSL